MSALKPWVSDVEVDDGQDAVLCSLLPPGEALRAEPGIMSGDPTAVLKAAAFETILGSAIPENELLSLTLLRSAIAGLEANEGSRLALDTVLRGLDWEGWH